MAFYPVNCSFVEQSGICAGLLGETFTYCENLFNAENNYNNSNLQITLNNCVNKGIVFNDNTGNIYGILGSYCGSMYYDNNVNIYNGVNTTITLNNCYTLYGLLCGEGLLDNDMSQNSFYNSRSSITIKNCYTSQNVPLIDVLTNVGNLTYNSITYIDNKGNRTNLINNNNFINQKIL